VPPIKTNFALGIELHVKFGDGDDSISIFNLDIITPQSSEFYFNKFLELFSLNMYWVKSLIICNGEYDYNNLMDDIHDYVHSSSMKTIPETLVMLGRYLEEEESDSKDYYTYLINSIRKGKG